MNKFAFLILILILIPTVIAEKNSIKLLAVNEVEKKGSIVDLELEIRDGSSKIFIETYPLSQIDTQISLRIAKIIACKTSKIYCLDKDFIYSLKSTSPVVAGPSAGAAMTLLTMATLEDKNLDSETTITGTINSGGVIGVVGGVKEKIKAASQNGLKRVLIPRGEENSTELVEYGKTLNLTIIEVSDIEEAYEIFTGKKIIYPELLVDERYTEIMKDLNQNICNRTESIKDDIDNYKIPDNSSRIFGLGINLSIESKRLSEKGYYYSSASRCFGANVYLREVLLRAQNISSKEIKEKRESINDKLKELDLYLNNTKINNLGDLEAEMVIRERIEDARKNLDEDSTNPIRDLSYAIERTYSSFAWQKFLGFPGKSIDESNLQESCVLKIDEVQELYNYATIYFPLLTEDIKKDVDSAKTYYDNNDYILCLFKASKSEAEINSALSTLYIGEENVKPLLQSKISAARKEIQRQEQKGIFPVLGYSYYEYATALNESDSVNALLYAEYGIELSNLDIYFPVERPLAFRINQKALVTLILGFIIGIALYSIRKQYTRKRIILRRKRR